MVLQTCFILYIILFSHSVIAGPASNPVGPARPCVTKSQYQLRYSAPLPSARTAHIAHGLVSRRLGEPLHISLPTMATNQSLPTTVWPHETHYMHGLWEKHSKKNRRETARISFVKSLSAGIQSGHILPTHSKTLSDCVWQSLI